MVEYNKLEILRVISQKDRGKGFESDQDLEFNLNLLLKFNVKDSVLDFYLHVFHRVPTKYRRSKHIAYQIIAQV